MNGTRYARFLALACALALPAARGEQARVAMLTCVPIVHTETRLPLRIDSLVAIGAAGAAVALTGSRTAAMRYLPHDSLALLPSHGAPIWRIALPPYVTPPGLAPAGGDASTLYAVIDNTVLVIAVHTGAIRTRIRLDVQALGWPAAVSAADGARLFIVGQPTRGWTAVVEALALGAARPAHVLWRARLGLYHAGIWLGPAGPGRLAAYLPGTYDAPGAMATLDARSGAVRHAYAVPAPPLAADSVHDRLYLEGAGSIRALTLGAGKPVAAVPGRAPLAVASARGLVAFAQRDGITLADARTLRVRGHVALPGVTALAVTPDAATLLAGLRGGLAQIDLAGCAAA